MMIEKALIMALLPIVLDTNRAPHLDFFMQFLETQGDLRITLDQWESFLQFNQAIRLDLTNWEEGGACKCLILSKLFLYVAYCYPIIYKIRATLV